MVDTIKDVQSTKFPKESVITDDWEDEITKPSTEITPSQELKLKAGAKTTRTSELADVPDEEVWKNVENRMDKAKRDLFDLWQMSVSIPFGDRQESSIHAIGSDRMASRVANEFRYNIKNIEMPAAKGSSIDTSRLSSTLTSILFPAQPPKTLVKSASEQVVPMRLFDMPVSEAPVDEVAQKKEIKARIGLLLNELVSGVFATFRGEQMALTNNLMNNNADKEEPITEHKDMQVEVLKGHLARRNKLLSEQRTAYLKELSILRDQLHRKNNTDDLPSHEATLETEDWGHLFDYGSDMHTLVESASASNIGGWKNSKVTNSTIAQIKNQFQQEKRKLKMQFERELKKQEVMYKQQLKAREKELMQTKVELAKKEEEAQEKISSIVTDYENTLNFFKTEQQEKIDLMSSQHAEEVDNLVKTEQAVTEIHGEKHLEVLEKLDDARREQRELLASKEAELRAKTTVIEELQSRLNKAMKANWDSDTPKFQIVGKTIMENRKVMMKQELLTQSILISDLEKRVDKANLDAERARMAYEDLSSSVIERGASFDDPDLAHKMNEVKKEIMRRKQSKGELDDKELLRKLKETEAALEEKLRKMDRQNKGYYRLLQQLIDTEKDLDMLPLGESDVKPPIIVTPGEKVTTHTTKTPIDSPKINYLKPDERPTSGSEKNKLRDAQKITESSGSIKTEDDSIIDDDEDLAIPKLDFDDTMSEEDLSSRNSASVGSTARTYRGMSWLLGSEKEKTSPGSHSEETRQRAADFLKRELAKQREEVNKLKEENTLLRQVIFSQQQKEEEKAYKTAHNSGETTNREARKQKETNQKAEKNLSKVIMSSGGIFSEDWVSGLSVFERLVFRARLLQQKFKFKIEQVDKLRRLKLERVLAHTELLSPKYNQEVLQRFEVWDALNREELTMKEGETTRRASPQPAPILPEPSKERVELIPTNTRPSITKVRSAPLMVTTIKTLIPNDPSEDGPPPGALITRPISAKRSSSPVSILPKKMEQQTASPTPSPPIAAFNKSKASYSVQIPRKLEKLTESTKNLKM